eukprot:8263870-Ditylum_brightwellii.AAC.1
MDNKASMAIINNMEDKKINVQLAPLHMHRQNLVEQAIRTFKHHFLAGLASTDPDFPKNGIN